MKHMILIYVDEQAERRRDPAELGRTFAAYGAYTAALREAGVMLYGEPLQPSSTSVRVRVEGGGPPQVLDGPYAETREQLGGFYVIDVPDTDAAVAWAARCPGAALGLVEVRPVMPMPG
jgi:hypothetical protein